MTFSFFLQLKTFIFLTTFLEGLMSVQLPCLVSFLNSANWPLMMLWLPQWSRNLFRQTFQLLKDNMSSFSIVVDLWEGQEYKRPNKPLSYSFKVYLKTLTSMLSHSEVVMSFFLNRVSSTIQLISIQQLEK